MNHRFLPKLSVQFALRARRCFAQRQCRLPTEPPQDERAFRRVKIANELFPREIVRLYWFASGSQEALVCGNSVQFSYRTTEVLTLLGIDHYQAWSFQCYDFAMLDHMHARFPCAVKVRRLESDQSMPPNQLFVSSSGHRDRPILFPLDLSRRAGIHD
jgi:hypothetical protein